ncbi:PLDc N-terminal domain-containing protein [Pseudooctadecabacter sp.]|uniref:PLDc N-terminal domain-containing protein n=1 Tax=Pseudooctadecabacter sp. TaxID=1966338 RepID=UPI0025DB89F4|nr:PLDc N-terminal domain-containing protein [Pseudooctadecabacter sp.]
MEYGIVGLIVLIADVYAIMQIISSSATTGAKILWTLLVLVLPVLGFIIWYFAGPRSSGTASV